MLLEGLASVMRYVTISRLNFDLLLHLPSHVCFFPIFFLLLHLNVHNFYLVGSASALSGAECERAYIIY